MSEQTVVNPLVRIQKGIDVLIAKRGSESTANLIESLSLVPTSKVYVYNVNLQQIILKSVIDTFKVSHKNLFLSVSENYKDARKCLFYLLKQHCGITPGAIKKAFPKYTKTRANIGAQIENMQQIIDLPKANNELHVKYMLINRTINQLKKEI